MDESFHWSFEPDRALTLTREGKTMLTYRFGDGTPKPYFHPLATPGGAILTSYQPSDHVWHRGLWFAWKYINGVNYWEEDLDADGTLVSEGRTEPVGAPGLSIAGDGSAELRHALRYVAPDGRVIMTENRRIVIRPSAGPELMIDLFHDFTVGDRAVTLEATPENEETPWGGYSGLGIRAARSLIDCLVVNDAGDTGGDANGARATWIDLTGTADGGPLRDRVAGLTLIDHPGNLRHPCPSYVYYDAAAFGYINPSLLRHEPLSLDAGAALPLAYRAVAHDGPADPGRLSQLAADFGASRPFDAWQKRNIG